MEIISIGPHVHAILLPILALALLKLSRHSLLSLLGHAAPVAASALSCTATAHPPQLQQQRPALKQPAARYGGAHVGPRVSSVFDSDPRRV